MNLKKIYLHIQNNSSFKQNFNHEMFTQIWYWDTPAE